ncbi:MAG: hypothetical protein ABFS19_05105 [Thermodesulfobacteriota bacterium]
MNLSRRLIVSLLLGAVSIFCISPIIFANQTDPAPAPLDYRVINGQWQRTDGNYLLKVSDVQTDGKVTAAYFNPRPVHIAQADISPQKELIKLFIKFDDKGYTGSTYKLYYFAEKDALVGFYHQAEIDKLFEVVFLRKP